MMQKNISLYFISSFALLLCFCAQRNRLLYENGDIYHTINQNPINLHLKSEEEVLCLIENSGIEFIDVIIYNEALRNTDEPISLPKSSLTMSTIEKENILSCDFIQSTNYYSQMVHILCVDDKIQLNTRDGIVFEGYIQFLNDGGLSILNINNKSHSFFPWTNLSNISFLKKSSNKLHTKTILVIAGVFIAFFFVINSITSIDFGLS